MSGRLAPHIEQGIKLNPKSPDTVVNPRTPRRTDKKVEASPQVQQVVKTLEKARNPHSALKDFSNPPPESDIEARKARIAGLWSVWKEVRGMPKLVSLFDRKGALPPGQDPRALLQEHDYPPRTRIDQLEFETWKANLDPKFVKDGHIYLLRGDHPNLEGKGFYTRPYGYGKKTTGQLTHDLRSSQEVGYFLYGNDTYLKTTKPSSLSIAQELAYKQSQKGGSSFVSTTTNLEAAITGTGNSPDPEEQRKYEVYVLRIPIDSVINSNTGNAFGREEHEYLVPDYIAPDEVVAKFARDDRESVYQYMSNELGVTREDLGLKPLEPETTQLPTAA